MKKMIFLFVAVMIAGTSVFAQNAPASPKKTTENAVASVTYSAPFKKDREIFGNLVPYGKVWRTGANEATEITFKKDVTFGGQAVKAGTYSLFTIPDKTEWTVILNPELKQWGSYGYDKIKDKDLPHFKVKAMTSPTNVEQLDLTLTADALNIAWEKSKVSIPIK